jgi:hypothetical protein
MLEEDSAIVKTHQVQQVLQKNKLPSEKSSVERCFRKSSTAGN